MCLLLLMRSRESSIVSILPSYATWTFGSNTSVNSTFCRLWRRSRANRKRVASVRIRVRKLNIILIRIFFFYFWLTTRVWLPQHWSLTEACGGAEAQHRGSAWKSQGGGIVNCTLNLLQSSTMQAENRPLPLLRALTVFEARCSTTHISERESKIIENGSSLGLFSTFYTSRIIWEYSVEYPFQDCWYMTERLDECLIEK